MTSRVFALLLVAVLLWSGFSTVTALRVDTQASPAQTIAVAHADGAAGALQGSVQQHHLDDHLAQTLSEPPPETPGLLAAPLVASGTWTPTAQPRSLASAEAGTPFLAGPLRPPCGAALAG